MSTLIRSALAVSFLVLVCARPSVAQCMQWEDRFGPTGTNGPVRAMTDFNDGSGPGLFAGGSFTVAGKVGANNIAKWNGFGWSPLAQGTNAMVNAVCVFDDGTGPALYAGGDFTTAGDVPANSVAKWNGTSWSPVGGGLTGVNGCCGAVTSVRALCVYDDGSGPALYAGGHFTMADGATAKSIAKWNGSSWTEVGGGMPPTSPNAVYVMTMTVFDAGGGPELYVGGNFGIVGGSMISLMAKWNGTSWSALSGGNLNSYPYAMTVFDDGTGPALFVGGFFTSIGGMTARKIAKWNGTSWSTLGSGMQTTSGSFEVDALTVFDNGSGAALYAGGRFNIAGGISAKNMAKWNGISWSSVSGGVDNQVRTLSVFGTVAGRLLVVGGEFAVAGNGVASARIASWDGAAWSSLAPSGQGLSAAAHVLTVHDDGSGPTLYAGGTFMLAGAVGASGVAKWNGSSWTAAGAGTGGGFDNTVHSLASFDDASGHSLFVGGSFDYAGGVTAKGIARWNGTSWSEPGGGLSFGATTYSQCVFDDGMGPALYVGGEIDEAGGGAVDVYNIAKWNGTSWSNLLAGLGGHNTAFVHALTVYDDGSGPALYAGGAFYSSGSTQLGRVAKWNGSSFSPLATGIGTISSTVYALAVFDDGSGPALYAGGEFTSASGVSTNNVAKWNGSSWSALGAGVNGIVHALCAFEDSTGRSLFAGGEFTTAGGVSVNRVAKWNGTSWSALGGGTNDTVRALASFDDGADGAPDLYVGGLFEFAEEKPSIGIAMWHGCEPGVAYCFGDGLDPVITVECPCGNIGDPGRGCANSNAALGGARLFASGTTNPNTVLLTCNGIPNNTLCTFLRSFNNNPGGLVFGDGIRCFNAPLFRFGSQNSGQIGNPPNTVGVGAFTEIPGSMLYYVLQYRNPAAFCTAATFNASNGYRITW